MPLRRSLSPFWPEPFSPDPRGGGGEPLLPAKAKRVRLGPSAMEYRCPICRKPTNSETDKDFPFCSERCRLQDLGNWASEKYQVSEPALDEFESPEPLSPDERKN